ncbi:hypothetical protein DFH09DRAFT_1079276 [Mycena vulgaris]|nr:hypothetical protein DFH09DRAFT_1079276 [Mycena vulgaris]
MNIPSSAVIRQLPVTFGDDEYIPFSARTDLERRTEHARSWKKKTDFDISPCNCFVIVRERFTVKAKEIYTVDQSQGVQIDSDPSLGADGRTEIDCCVWEPNWERRLRNISHLDAVLKCGRNKISRRGRHARLLTSLEFWEIVRAGNLSSPGWGTRRDSTSASATQREIQKDGIQSKHLNAKLKTAQCSDSFEVNEASQRHLDREPQKPLGHFRQKNGTRKESKFAAQGIQKEMHCARGASKKEGQIAEVAHFVHGEAFSLDPAAISRREPELKLDAVLPQELSLNRSDISRGFASGRQTSLGERADSCDERVMEGGALLHSFWLHSSAFRPTTAQQRTLRWLQQTVFPRTNDVHGAKNALLRYSIHPNEIPAVLPRAAAMKATRNGVKTNLLLRGDVEVEPEGE